MKRKLQFFMTLLLLFGGVSGVWADDTSVTFGNGITWERAHGISNFDDTNKVITGTTSNWGAIGYKTVEGTSYTLEKDRLTWLVITGTNLSKGTNNPCVFDINGELGTKIKYVDSKSSETKIVIDITKYLPEPDGSGNVTITSLGFYLDDPNGTAGDHEIEENQPTITNIEIVYPETDSPISAKAEICYKSNNDNSGWTNTWEANATNAEYEINYKNGFFALQKYKVENLATVKSLTVHIYGDGTKGHDAMAIWAFGDNDWSTSSNASELVEKVTTVVGIAPHADTGDAKTPLVNGTSNRYTADGVQHCLFVISGDALATLKESATDDTFTLLITNRTSDLKQDKQRKYYTSGQTIVPFRPYIEVTPYPAVVDNVGYETLNAAFDGIPENGTGTINLYDNITITSICNTGNKTINVVPVKDVTISSSINNGLWLLNNSASGRLTIGSDEHQLTIDGSTVTNSSNMLEASVNGSETTVNNVLFKNCTSTNSLGVVCVKNGGKLYMKGCAFDGCVAPDGRGVVFCGVNDGVVLSGNNTFTNITTGYDMYLERRFKIHETEGITNTTPIKIFAQENNIGLNNPVATKASDDDVARFFVMNPTYALFMAAGSGRRDLKVCEGKTLEVSSYGAATFVLPFNATIPEGVECYTLNYTEEKANVKATPVLTTLSANTPVLVNASHGLYKFRNAENATTATSYETSATPRVGALTGVYTTTDVPEGSYILYADESNPIGFYKSNNSTVAANRAYLTADGAGARSITVVYDDDELTGIKSVESGKVQAEGVYYDLSGRRVAQPTKGLYIVNGKKVIIK